MPYKEWSSNILFLGLTDEQLEVIDPYVGNVTYAPAQIIMREGDPGTFMFMIDEGSVSVYKNELKLTVMVAGDLAGLMSLIDQNPRSATVIAGEKGARGYLINKDGFGEIMSEEKNSIVSTMLLNYLKYQQDAIRNTNALSLQEARAKLEQEQERVRSARFFVQMVIGLILLTFFLEFFIKRADPIASTYISFILIAIYGLWSYFYVRMSGIPLESFGLTMHNFRPAFKMTMKATMLFLGFLFLAKWTMITWFPQRFGTQLIEPYKAEIAGLATPWILVLLYATYASIQEFIARGCIQGGLLQFIIGPRAAWTAIVVATLMFSSFYLLLDLHLAILTIIPGLFWGYLFDRERNILAVSISHMIIGLVAIFLLNLV